MVAAWMYYRRPCNLPFRWRLPRTKGNREKGVHRPQAGNVKLWTIICWAKYNACQMNWSSTSKDPAAPPPKTLQRKVVCECVCVQVCLYFSLPSPHPLTHVHSDTNARSNYHQFNCLKKKREDQRQHKKKDSTLSAGPHDAPRLFMEKKQQQLNVLFSLSW